MLILGTGGLSHDPERLFPAIDDVSDEWRPYHLLGNRQSEVPQARWIAYEHDAHHAAAGMLARGEIPMAALKISAEWDRGFLDLLAHGDLASVDRWTPRELIAQAGFGAMEVLSWVAAVQCMADATGVRPTASFQCAIPEVGVGFGITETDPVPLGNVDARLAA